MKPLRHCPPLLCALALLLLSCTDPSSSGGEGGEPALSGVSMPGGVEEGGAVAGAEGCEPSLVESGMDGEGCDGVDNDCDGQVDEGYDIGERCERRLNACSSEGVFVCDDEGSRRCDAPEINQGEERCDEQDNDCDGEVDEGFNTQIDINNCGGCGVECSWAHGSGTCVEGSCVLAACDQGWTTTTMTPVTAVSVRQGRASAVMASITTVMGALTKISRSGPSAPQVWGAASQQGYSPV